MVGSNEAAVRTNVSYTVRHFRYLWRQDVFQDRQLDYWLLDSFVQVVKRTAKTKQKVGGAPVCGDGSCERMYRTRQAA